MAQTGFGITLTPMTIAIHFESETATAGFLFNFGAYGETHLAVMIDGGSIESALEAAFEWLDENAPGLLCRVDYEGAAKELGIECSSTVDECYSIQERAEADLTICSHTTLKHGDAIPSHEWYVRELTSDETAEILATGALAVIG